MTSSILRALTPRAGRRGTRAFFSAAAREAGLGVLVDIVPNHMGVSDPAQNPWWWDVLRAGRDSQHARAFDIDWDFGDGRVRLPILGDELDACGSSAGSSSVDADGAVLRYNDHLLPLARARSTVSGSRAAVLGCRRGPGGPRASALRAPLLAARVRPTQLPSVLRGLLPSPASASRIPRCSLGATRRSSAGARGTRRRSARRIIRWPVRPRRYLDRLAAATEMPTCSWRRSSSTARRPTPRPCPRGGRRRARPIRRDGRDRPVFVDPPAKRGSTRSTHGCARRRGCRLPSHGRTDPRYEEDRRRHDPRRRGAAATRTRAARAGGEGRGRPRRAPRPVSALPGLSPRRTRTDRERRGGGVRATSRPRTGDHRAPADPDRHVVRRLPPIPADDRPVMRRAWRTRRSNRSRVSEV